MLSQFLLPTVLDSAKLQPTLSLSRGRVHGHHDSYIIYRVHPSNTQTPTRTTATTLLRQPLSNIHTFEDTKNFPNSVDLVELAKSIH